VSLRPGRARKEARSYGACLHSILPRDRVPCSGMQITQAALCRKAAKGSVEYRRVTAKRFSV